MSDSTHEPTGEDRPKRQGSRPDRTGGARHGAPRRDGERRSSADRSAYGRPDRERRDGEKKHYGAGSRDADRKPYGRPARDGERKPYGAGSRDGDRKSYGRPAREGERKPYGAGSRDGERKPYGAGSRDADRRPYGRPARDGDRRGRDDARSAERTPRIAGHGAADLRVRPRHDDPEVPDRITPRDLDSAARAELKTLSKENADWVARHLAAAAEVLESDPLLAHRHALSAARRAGRVGVVRETLAITAYATGDFALALRELRTYRRLTGSDEQLPLMVDSERGVGRPDRALELGRSVERSTLSPSVQAALAIAMSGARLDLGQPDLALAELEVPQLDPDRAFSYSPALFSAYAEVLEELGRIDDATRWRGLAERAEAALAGTLPDLVEVFELEEDGAVAEIDEVAAPDGIAEPVVDGTEADAAGSAPTDGDADDAEGDPADAIEPDVAAILAETAELDDDPAGHGGAGGAGVERA